MLIRKSGIGHLPLGIIALCATLIAILWTALLFDMDRRDNQAISQAGNDARNLAMAFRENVTRTVSAIDQLMLTILSANQGAGTQYRIPAWVKNSVLLKGLSVQVSIADSRGIMVASTLPSTGVVDISDRPHFRHHLDPSASEPYISAPVIGRISRKASIQITRRISNNDGSFGGVLVVSVDPSYFSRFFESVDVGKQGSVDLVGTDGIVRARRAQNDSAIGQDVSATRLFRLMRSQRSGNVTARGRIDGVTRIFGYSAVPEYPMFVTVGLAMNDVLAPVHQQRWMYFAVGAFLTLVIAGLGLFLARESKLRREREVAAIADAIVLKQKALLDVALDNMRHGLLMFDKDGKALVVNNAYAEIYGLSTETAKQGCTIRQLLEHRSANGSFAGNIDEYIRQNFVNDRVVHKVAEIPDGRSVSITNQFLADGGWVSIHQDISERISAEEDRDRNREFLNRIIDNISVTIHVKDARTLKYLLVNTASEKLWGIPREAIIGKTPHEIFDKETADLIVKRDRELLKSGAPFYTPQHKIETPHNGIRYVTSNRIAVRGQSGEVEYLLGVIEDVTDRKGMEEQLRQSQKMEAVGNLTGGIAHDFNNLLTVILGNLDLLQEELAGNPSAEEKINIVVETAERGADLTKHMLAFSRRQPLQAKPTDVNALIAPTIRLLDRTLGEDISVAIQTSPGLTPALVDPSQLETALLNIAINARDAMPNGGTLTLTTGMIDFDSDYSAAHLDVAPGSYIAIEITDTGCGMPPEMVQRIFDPFFTTKAAGRGTGLGLSMVYGFIKQSGGHISVYSEVGHGTTFRLFLPAAEVADQAAVKIRPKAVTAAPVGNARILVVEDNPSIRTIVVRQLRELGYRVQETENAAEALNVLANGEPVDLLFTDVIMPGGMNGKELAVQAQANNPDLKVLFTSGFPGTAANLDSQLGPDDALLSKPYHKRDLADAVERALHPFAPGIVPDDSEPASQSRSGARADPA